MVTYSIYQSLMDSMSMILYKSTADEDARSRTSSISQFTERPFQTPAEKKISNAEKNYLAIEKIWGFKK